MSGVNRWLINLILIILLLNIFIFKIDVINLIVMSIGIIGFVYANRHTLKQLSLWQITRIILLVIGAILILSSLYYYVANPLVDLITISVIKYIVIVLFVIVTFIPSITMLYKLIENIVREGQVIKETRKIDYPENDEIKRLVYAGKDIQAIKRAREVYGFSLLEAKQYTDQLK